MGKSLFLPFHRGPRRISGHREVGKEKAGFEQQSQLRTEWLISTTSSSSSASAPLSPVLTSVLTVVSGWLAFFHPAEVGCRGMEEQLGGTGRKWGSKTGLRELRSAQDPEGLQ